MYNQKKLRLILITVSFIIEVKNKHDYDNHAYFNFLIVLMFD